MRSLSKFCVSPLPVPASGYAIPLRLIVGFGFIEHGYAKLAHGPGVFIAILHAIGIGFGVLIGRAARGRRIAGLAGGAAVVVGAVLLVVG